MSRIFHAVVVLVVVTSYAAVYGLRRLAIQVTSSAADRPASVARLRGRTMRRAMERLGATFIKLGQVMSSRPDLLPPETIAELEHLQDRLPAFPLADVERIVAEDLGRPLGEIYASFDATPIAAASVAQVHRAELTTGELVAVKVLRPAVRRQVQRDAALLIGMARVARLHPTLRLSDPVGHMRHFVRGIEEQTDLGRELDHYARFRTNFEGRPGVVFPEVHPTLSGPRVLTMELLIGRKIDTLNEGDHDLDVDAISRRMRTSFFQMCFEDGFVHADLHPGNILVTHAGDVALFDVGLVQAIDDEVLEQLIDFARCISFGDLDDFVRHLRRFHGYVADTDWDQIRIDASTFIDRFRGKTQAELEWSQMLDQVFAIMRRHHLRPMPEVMLVMVGVVTAEGVGKMLEADVDTLSEMATFLLPILARRGMLPKPPASASA